MLLTQEQVDSINASQKRQDRHPLTCGKNRTDKKHLDGEGRLVATLEGLVCPYCDYKQDYASISNILHIFLPREKS